MNKLIFFLCLLTTSVYSQQYITNQGKISFFSKAPLEDISAINNRVSAIYDLNTKEIAFSLNIVDFIFPIPLMQDHFNENYLESDLYPKSTFTGKIIDTQESTVRINGSLNIHGQENNITVDGLIIEENNNMISMSATFFVKLEDYNIDIPRIVMYKIAEEIRIDVQVDLNNLK